MTDPRRLIPGVDRLTEDAAALIGRFGRERVVQALRDAVQNVRDRVASGESVGGLDEADLYLGMAEAGLQRAEVASLRGVVNATGVVLHTNLGRAPLCDSALAAMSVVGPGYGNLEYDLEAGERGSRYDHCADLIRELTGAEDGLVVNNCAAALVLVLGTLARGRGVLVSRGELVEIGGGFRVPEIMEESGARLVEVGSTNRTRLADYRAAAEASAVALILKVHRSNFRISGFTEEAELEDLVALGEELGLPVVHDLGSGLLVDPATLGLPAEPLPQESIEAGAAVVTFSGDKLLGGPQAGLIAGAADTVARLRRSPLCRALRVDKTTLAALEATLREYRDPERALERVPVLRMLAASVEELHTRAAALVGALEAGGVIAEVEEARSVVGGGTYPGVEIPSAGIRVDTGGLAPDAAASRLRDGDRPVVVRVDDRGLHLDLRTIRPQEEDHLVGRLLEVVRGS